MKLAFIGLGVMGYPMAGHLQRAGHSVTVFNRSAEKARLWCDEYGGESASTPELAAQGADIVFVCVGNDDDVRQVTTGDEGALARMSEGALLVDHISYLNAETQRNISRTALSTEISLSTSIFICM